jgi:hypothetical protein
VFNVVEFLSESWSPDLDTSVGNGWLGNIDKLLGNSLGKDLFGHWNISVSGIIDRDLVVSISDLLGNGDSWSVVVLKGWSSLSVLIGWSSLSVLEGWSSLSILDSWGSGSVLDTWTSVGVVGSNWLGRSNRKSRSESAPSEGNSSRISIGIGSELRGTRVGTSYGQKAQHCHKTLHDL